MDKEFYEPFVITRPYEMVDPFICNGGGRGHSTKHANHNGHTKLRKAKRRLNKKYNK